MFDFPHFIFPHLHFSSDMSKRKATKEVGSDMRNHKNKRLEIGRGTTGAVYDIGDDKVIKVISSIRCGKREGYLHRYAFDVSPLHVPRLFTEREEEGMWALEMEKLTGFLDEPKAHSPFLNDEKELKKLARSFISLLREFHAADLLHGDLNLRNLSWDKSKEMLKIVDFGHAAITYGPGLADHPSHRDEMAPETACGLSSYAAASEWYAMGRIMYELFTGTEYRRYDSHHEQWDSLDVPVLKNRSQLHNLLRKLLHPSEKKRLTGSKILDHPWFHDTLPLIATMPSGYDHIGIDTKVFASKFKAWIELHDIREGSWLALACLLQLALTESGDPRWIAGLHKKVSTLSFHQQLDVAERLPNLVPCGFNLRYALIVWMQRDKRIVTGPLEFRQVLRECSQSSRYT
jgi:serine/threonine protein kinase